MRFQLGEAMDLDFPPHDIADGDGGNVLPEAEPFPEMAAPAISQPSFLEPSSLISEERGEGESAEASMRRRPRGPRVLPTDNTQELRSSYLTQWNNQYPQNMAEASYHKLQHRLPYQAKKNAASWVFGLGIGGVGAGLGSLKLASPLAIFAGDRLRQALIGIDSSTTEKKRPHPDGEGQTSESAERRIRQRSDEGSQIGRGNELALEEIGLPPIFDDTVRLSFPISTLTFSR